MKVKVRAWGQGPKQRPRRNEAYWAPFQDHIQLLSLYLPGPLAHVNHSSRKYSAGQSNGSIFSFEGPCSQTLTSKPSLANKPVPVTKWWLKT